MIEGMHCGGCALALEQLLQRQLKLHKKKPLLPQPPLQQHLLIRVM